MPGCSIGTRNRVCREFLEDDSLGLNDDDLEDFNLTEGADLRGVAKARECRDSGRGCPHARGRCAPASRCRPATSSASTAKRPPQHRASRVRVAPGRRTSPAPPPATARADPPFGPLPAQSRGAPPTHLRSCPERLAAGPAHRSVIRNRPRRGPRPPRELPQDGDRRSLGGRQPPFGHGHG